MPNNCFHPSIEGAQHGAKSLAQFLDYAAKSGAAGAQPSNFMLQSDKGFKSAKMTRMVEITKVEAAADAAPVAPAAVPAVPAAK